VRILPGRLGEGEGIESLLRKIYCHSLDLFYEVLVCRDRRHGMVPLAATSVHREDGVDVIP